MRYERFDAEPAGVQGEGLERKRIKERNKPKRQDLNDTMHGLTLQIKCTFSRPDPFSSAFTDRPLFPQFTLNFHS